MAFAQEMSFDLTCSCSTVVCSPESQQISQIIPPSCPSRPQQAKMNNIPCLLVAGTLSLACDLVLALSLRRSRLSQAKRRSYGCSCQSGQRTSPRCQVAFTRLSTTAAVACPCYNSAIIAHPPRQLWSSGCLLRPTLPFPAALETRFSSGSQGSQPKNANGMPITNKRLRSPRVITPATCQFYPHATATNTDIVYSPGYTRDSVAPPSALAGGPDMSFSRVLKLINHSVHVKICTRPALRC